MKIDFSIKIPDQHKEYAFLDGIRGIAALYVAVFHAVGILPMDNMTPLILFIRELTSQGKFAVAVFITLSGFVLALPYAKNGMERWDWNRFIKRRARRIMPPYYIAAVLSIPWCIVFHYLRHQQLLNYKMLLGVFLLQYLDGTWKADVNGPHWTIGVEFTIYIIFGLLYIRVWKNLGMYAMLGVAILLGFSPLIYCVLMKVEWYYPWYYPSYFGMFGVGGFTAWICSSKAPKRWLHLWVFGALILLMVGLKDEQNKILVMIRKDYFACIYTSLLICFVHAYRSTKIGAVVHGFLVNKYVLFLGMISYSVYLVHYPFVTTCAFFLKKFSSYNLLYILQCVMAIVLSVGFGYIFHLFFEKPFLNAAESPKKVDKKEI